MDSCPIHALQFVPYSRQGSYDFNHPCSDKPADVVDLACPVCGHKIFVYYRHAPSERGEHERSTEATTDSGADRNPPPQERPQQQEEGDKK